MALQVWLPLTKDLRNQGLSNVTVTNNGATFNSAGKLGGCYNFTTSSYQKIGFPYSLANYTEFTVCVWVKPVSTTITGCLFTFINPNDYWQFVITNGNSVGIRDNSSGETGSRKDYTLGSFVANVWTHLAISYNKGIVKIYKDGVLFSTNNTGGSAMNNYSGTNAAIGESVTSSSSYYFVGSVNDFRIYDHCLSPMEVKQLSQGLVLHYPLNRGGFGVNNILVNTHFDSRYTQSTGWDTTKNGTQLANSWGGYNSGVTNQATVYHAHLKEFNGEWVYEYIRTANESWLGISQGGLQSKLTAGKTYTFSWEEYHVDGTNRVGTGLYYYKTGATSANFHLGIQQATGIIREIGKWQKYTYTFTAPSDADWSKNMSWYVYGHYNGNGTFYVRHIKLEEGSVATPWCPNSSDALATTMGFNGTTEYDCSGFCNNGTRTGTFDWTSDTPKYSVSQYFNGSSYSKTDSGTFSWFAFDKCTVAIWMKPTTLPSSWAGTFGIAHDNSSTNKSFVIGNYGGKFTVQSANGSWVNIQASDLPINEWHHCVATLDGTTIKMYMDGELVKTDTINWGTTTVASDTRVQVGIDLPGSDEVYQGYYSDARIYATALSADDVKSLYQNCATIDADGTIHGQIRS